MIEAPLLTRGLDVKMLRVVTKSEMQESYLEHARTGGVLGGTLP